MSTSDDLVFTAVKAVVQTLADTAGHAAAAATHVIATPTRALVNAGSAVAVSITTFALFTVTRATVDAAWWIGTSVAGAASTAVNTGYSTLFPPPPVQYAQLQIEGPKPNV